MDACTVSQRQSRGGAHEAAFNQRFHIVHSTIEPTSRCQCIGVAGARVTNTPLIFHDWAVRQERCMNEAVGRRVGTGEITLTGAGDRILRCSNGAQRCVLDANMCEQV
jgi:hypothetical protein